MVVIPPPRRGLREEAGVPATAPDLALAGSGSESLFLYSLSYIKITF